MSVGGALQIIAREPFLQWPDGSDADALTVSGIPGTEYIVQQRTNLVAGIWAERMRFTLGSDELQTTVTLPPTDDTLYFLRILEVE